MYAMKRLGEERIGNSTFPPRLTSPRPGHGGCLTSSSTSTVSWPHHSKAPCAGWAAPTASVNSKSSAWSKPWMLPGTCGGKLVPTARIRSDAGSWANSQLVFVVSAKEGQTGQDIGGGIWVFTTDLDMCFWEERCRNHMKLLGTCSTRLEVLNQLPTHMQMISTFSCKADGV